MEKRSFSVVNKKTGIELGIYQGSSAFDAWASLMYDVGYSIEEVEDAMVYPDEDLVFVEL